MFDSVSNLIKLAPDGYFLLYLAGIISVLAAIGLVVFNKRKNIKSFLALVLLSIVLFALPNTKWFLIQYDRERNNVSVEWLGHDPSVAQIGERLETLEQDVLNISQVVTKEHDDVGAHSQLLASKEPSGVDGSHFRRDDLPFWVGSSRPNVGDNISYSRDHNAIKIMAFNAEWLWDDEEPHEGTLCKEKILGCPPEKDEYEKELEALAQHIHEHGADLVGLSEIENEKVAKDIVRKLGSSAWAVAFSTGRDTVTGQNVALFVKEPFKIIKETITTFQDVESTVVGITEMPPKILGVKLQRSNKTYYVIVAHLLPPIRVGFLLLFSSLQIYHDIQHLAQADAVRKAILKTVAEDNNIDHFIVMGNLNDFRESDVLKRIRGLDDNNCPQLQQFASGDREIYSYAYENNFQLIDHILVDPSLETVSASASDAPFSQGERISNHRSVLATVKTDSSSHRTLCE